MKTHTQHNPRHPRKALGFTMMEVLVSIAIFTVGMVAVASIFPVAVLLQKETVYSVEAKHFGSNAEALVDVIGFTDTAVNWDAVENDADAGVAGTGPDEVVPLPQSAFEDWSIADRSHNSINEMSSRNVFWVPLVYDGDSAADSYAWRIYLFVVRGRDDGTYNKDNPDALNTDINGWADENAALANRDSTSNPGIPGVCRISANATGVLNATYGGYEMAFDNAPRIVFPGNQVVDANGIVYTVKAVTDTAIYVDGPVPGAPVTLNVWAAHPGDQTVSSFVKLITLIEETQGTLVRQP